MIQIIQRGKIPSDVNPKIHTLEKKLKAFSFFDLRISFPNTNTSRFTFKQFLQDQNVFISFSCSSCHHLCPLRWQMDQCWWK